MTAAGKPAAVTEADYAAKRAEWEMLALAVDDKALSDGDYWKARLRLDALNRVFESHWRAFHRIHRHEPTRASDRRDMHRQGDAG